MGEDSRATSQAGSAGKWLVALVVLGAAGIGLWRLDSSDKKQGERLAPRPPPQVAPVQPPEPAATPRAAAIEPAEPAPASAEPTAPASAEPTAPASVEPSSHTPGTPPVRKLDELSCLLDPDGPGCPLVATGLDPEEPLSKAEVLAGVTKIKPAIMRCHDKYRVEGSLKVRFIIEPSGKVSFSEGAGDLSDTPSADCVAKAFRGVRFKRFTGARMYVVFPVVLR